jgi:hypothetical protein
MSSTEGLTVNKFIISNAYPFLNIPFVILMVNLIAFGSSVGCQLLVNLLPAASTLKMEAECS